MTSSTAHSVIRHALRTGLLAGMTLLTSCDIFTPPPPMPPPPFSPAGRPRYGYGGTDSPGYADAPAALPGTNSNPAATGTPNKPVRINRNPNNTTVNIEPPKPGNTTPSVTETPPSVTPPPATDSGSPASTPSTPAPKPPSAKDDLPFGTPVVGKGGFVYSPYAEEKGYVDVGGLKRGTRVKCPYTGKHFRVP